MRALIVTILLALALPGLALQNICPFNNITDDTVEFVTAGQHYYANGCTFNGEVYLSAYNAPTSGNAISVTVENSVVNEILYFEFVNSDFAENAVPLYITFRSNLFANNAVFQTYNSFPPNSALTFESNQMSSNSSMYRFDGGVIFVYFQYISFYTNATINIVSNTLTSNSLYQDVYVYPIYFEGIGDGSGNNTVNIKSNTITTNGSYSGILIYLDSYYMESYSTLNVNANKMTVANSLRSVTVISFDYITCNEQDCTVFINSNEISVSAADTDDSSVISLYDIRYMNLYIENNAVVSNSWHFISSGTRFYYHPYVSIKGNSYRSTNASITTPLISLYRYYNAENATLVVASNQVTAPSVTTNNTHFLTSIIFAVDGGFTVRHCGNTLPWADASTPAEQLFPAELTEYLVYDSAACVAATTRAPSAVAFTSFSFAALVCLLVALIALL